MTGQQRTDEPGRILRVVRIVLVGVGLVAAGYGAYGLVAESRPIGVAAFAAAAVLGHDLVLAPLALLVGAVAGRLTPPRLRSVVRTGLILTGTVLIVSLPLLLGFGRRATNPSALPLNYPLGLAVTVAAVWLGTGLVALLRRRHP